MCVLTYFGYKAATQLTTLDKHRKYFSYVIHSFTDRGKVDMVDLDQMRKIDM